MKEWKIEIAHWDTVGVFATGRSYTRVERKLSELESAGWAILSITAEPNSMAVMIVCWRMKP